MWMQRLLRLLALALVLPACHPQVAGSGGDTGGWVGCESAICEPTQDCQWVDPFGGRACVDPCNPALARPCADPALSCCGPVRDGGPAGWCLPSKQCQATDGGALDAASADANLPADAQIEPGVDAGVDAATEPPADAAADADLPDATAPVADVGQADVGQEAADGATPPDADAASAADVGTDSDAGSSDDVGTADTGGGVVRIRVMAANLSSGNNQSYDPGEGMRLIQGVDPDIILVQEFNYGSNSDADIQKMVNTMRPGFFVCREPGGQIPNGIVSRWPILGCGDWTDPQVSNRGFPWARIDIPGPVDLWAVSLHFLTTGTSDRSAEAAALKKDIQTNIPAGDYLVIGGDLNTGTRSEACFGTLSAVVVTSYTYPVDQNKNGNTSANRSKPYDNVIASPGLHALAVPTLIGSSTFPSGLVLDSRVYTPLSEIPPVQYGDSAASNMQHMGVVRDFSVSY